MNELALRFRYLLMLLVAVWLVFLIQVLTGDLLMKLALEPRTLRGLDGVLFAPVLHGGFSHIASNTAGLALLGALVCAHHSTAFFRVTMFVVILGGLATWLFARPALHIGASGLVFGYFGYLIMRALVEKTFKGIIIAALVIFLYGGLIWGVLPSQGGISWEGHLFGFLAGLLAARWRIHLDEHPS